MRQVLDIFLLLQDDASPVQWKLIHATTNSPFQLQGEAVGAIPGVDVSVVARHEKAVLSRALKQMSHGRYPEDWADSPEKVPIAKRLLARNVNGIGATTVEFDDS